MTMTQDQAAHVTHADRQYPTPEPEFTDADGWIWRLTLQTDIAIRMKDEAGFDPLASDLVEQIKAIEDSPRFLADAAGLVWWLIEKQGIKPRRPGGEAATTNTEPASTINAFWRVLTDGEAIESAWLAFCVGCALFSRKQALLRLLGGKMREKAQQMATAVLDQLEAKALDVDTDQAASEIVDAVLGASSSTVPAASV